MRYQPIHKSFYQQNRAKLAAQMKPNSMVIFNANDIMPTNADGTMPFRQNNDLFYLSGVDQEETILLMYPDSKDEQFKEVLFVKETSESIAIWEGNKLTKEEARNLSGIDTVYWLSEFESTLNRIMPKIDVVHLNSNEHGGANLEIETRDKRFANWCMSKYPLHIYERIAPLMHRLRVVKSKEEIDAMQHACDITERGFRRVLKYVKPGVKEYEIEAEFIHEFIKSGSRGFGYSPIVASGANSCVLHYVENDQVCNAGDILLMDIGAEYGNYNADMSRTIPVSGKFTPRQKAVYNAVLKVKKEAIKMLTPGTLMRDYHSEVGKIMESELIGLGLLDKTGVKNAPKHQPAYRKYFMHGTSHHLGLDVHDVGNTNEPFEVGMVLTVEPGIYIREESIGVRLENNIVITENGTFDLMRNIPIEAEEIEDLMNA